MDDLPIEQKVIKILSMLPILIVVIGTLGNFSAFMVFKFSSHMNRMSSMTYLSFISIADTFSLFVWNLDHFFLQNYSFKIENLGIVSCKLLSFIQFASLQISGLLHAILSIDRYYTITSKPGSSTILFGTPKRANIWSLGITTFVILLNMHLLIFNGYWHPESHHISNTTDEFDKARLNREFSIEISNFLCYYSKYYQILPFWNRVHMVIYIIIPFVSMTIFNFLLIKRTFYTRSNRLHNNIHTLRRRRLTISLLFITSSFIIMTLPGTIVYGFFYDYFFSFKSGEVVAMSTDSLMFFQHSSIFFISFLSNYKFRNIVTSLANQLIAFTKPNVQLENYDLTARLIATKKLHATTKPAV